MVNFLNFKDKSNVFIYGSNGFVFLKYIVSGRSSQLISFNKIYINFSVLIDMVRNIALIKHGPLFLNHACMLRVKRPEIVITYCDNHPLYHKLDKLLGDEILFITIQNGNRFFNVPSKNVNTSVKGLNFQEKTANLENVYHTNFFCFSEFDKILYKKLGATIKFYHPVGSIKNSFYLQGLKKTQKEYDLCFIATNRSVGNVSTYKNHDKIFTLLCEWLSRYVSEFPDKKICIAGSMHNFNEELKWFKKYNLDKFLIKYDGFSSYKVIDKSEVSFSCMTTLYFESLSRGNKMFLIEAYKNLELRLPTIMKPSQFLYLYGDSYNEFRAKVNELINMPQDSFLLETHDYVNFMMTNSKHLFAHEYIKNYINLHFDAAP
jgi:surface carbohydrate biosynthesis protein